MEACNFRGILMDFSQFKKAVIEKKHGEIVRLSSELHEEAMKLNDFSAAAEMLLFNAASLATMGDFEIAREVLETYLETMNDKIPEFRYLRGKILYARLLLREGKLTVVKKFVDSLGQSAVCQSDPLLRNDIELLITEMSAFQTEYLQGQKTKLIKDLQRYLDNSFLIFALFGTNYSNNRILSGASAIDYLMKELIEAQDYDGFLFWMERAKTSSFFRQFVTATLPFKGLSKTSVEKLNTLKKLFIDSANEYADLIVSIKNSSVSKEKNNTINPLFIKTAKQLNKHYQLFIQELEYACKISPINNIFGSFIPTQPSELASMLDDGEAIINYYQSENELFILIITNLKKSALKINSSTALIKKLIENYLKIKTDNCSENNKNRRREKIDLLNASQQIYNAVFEPLTPELDGIKKILICPDGDLFGLPFQTLWNGIQFLSDKYEVLHFTCIQNLTKYLERKSLGFVAAESTPGEFYKIVRKIWNDGSQENNNSFLSVGGCLKNQQLLNFLKNKIISFDESGVFSADQPLESLINFNRKDAGYVKDFFTCGNPPIVALLTPDFIKNKLNYPVTSDLLKKLVYFTTFLGIECLMIDKIDAVSDNEEIIQVNADSGSPKDEDLARQDETVTKQNIGKEEAWNDVFEGHILGQVQIPQEPIYYHNSPDKVMVFYAGRHSVLTEPVVKDNFLIFGGEDNYLYAVNPSTGSILWRHKTGDWIKENPVISEKVIYFGGHDKRVRAVGLTDGKRKWDFKTGGWIMDTPKLTEKSIYIISKDNCIYQINRDTGEMMASARLSSKLSPPLLLSESSALVFTTDGSVTAFSQKNLLEMWKRKLSDENIEAADIQNDLLIYGDNYGKIGAFKIGSDRKKWEKETGKHVKFIKNDGDNIYVLFDGGLLLCINSQNGQTIWKNERLSEALVTFALDSKIIWAQSAEKSIIGINKTTGNIILELLGFYEYIKCITPHEGNFFVVDVNGNLCKILSEKTPVYTEDKKSKKDISVKLPYPLFNQDLLEVSEIKYSDSSGALTLEELNKKDHEIKYTSQSDITFCIKIMEGNLLLGTDLGDLICLNGKSLTEKWKTRLEARLERPPEVFKGHMLIGDVSGKFYLIDPPSGKVIRTSKICNHPTSRMTTFNGYCFFGGDDGYLYCIDGLDLEESWQTSIGRPIRSTPVIIGNFIYAVSRSGRLIKVDVTTGRISRSISVLEAVNFDPIVTKKHIVLTSSQGCIFAVDIRTGKLDWKYQYAGNEFTGTPVATDNFIFIGVTRGEILVLENEMGNIIKKIKLDKPLTSPPVRVGNLLLMTTADNEIIAWHMDTMKLYIWYKLEESCWIPIVHMSNFLYVVSGGKTVKRFPIKQVEEKLFPAFTEPAEEPPEDKKIPKSDDSGNDVSNDGSLKNEKKLEKNNPGSKEKKQSYEKFMTPENQKGGEQKFWQEEENDFLYKLFIFTMPFIIAIEMIITKIIGADFLFKTGFILFIITTMMFIIELVQLETQRMKNLVNKFVPQRLLNKFSKGDRTMEKEVTILFQDLYNYTAITELLSSEEVYDLLRQIDVITNEVVNHFKGEIMSYVGDAQMIAFNAGMDVEDHPIQAVKTALEINKRIKLLEKKLHVEKKENFPFKLRMGFGINTGIGLIGVRGGSNKLEPFVIGDTTNTAVRLQKLTREVDYNILVSSATAARISGNFKVRDLGLFALKGKKNPTRVYAVEEKDDKKPRPLAIKPQHGYRPSFIRPETKKPNFYRY